MKKLLLVCCILIGISTLSRAQGFQRPTAEETLATYKTALTLTDAQSAKILPVLTAQSKSMDSLITAANGDFGSMREKMTPLRAKYTAQIKAVLTADQQAAYDKMPQRGRRGGQGGGGAPPPQR